MRTHLINQSHLILQSWGITPIFQPTGLAHIATMIEKKHKVFIIDARAEDWKNIQETGGKYHLGLSFAEIAGM